MMYLGRIVEIAAARKLFDEPLRPHTIALLSAIPALDPERKTLPQKRNVFREIPPLKTGYQKNRPLAKESSPC
jgi:ABC-type oligopeptide transport system ATPase subunit